MQISIAIPDSCLQDEKTQINKSRKISIIARAASIFEVKDIFIYSEGGSLTDKSLLITNLKYLQTPPFLRKKLFPKINELKYAGVLQPLNIKKHTSSTNIKKIKINDVREGFIISNKGIKFIDIGLEFPLRYFGKKQVGEKIIIQFKTGFPKLDFKEITEDKIPYYWGYKVKERGKLSSLISNWNGKTILTSKKGKMADSNLIKEYQNSKEHILIVFGSIKSGIYDILGNKIKYLQNSRILNFFPHQGTETIRLEEAIIGVLSIINFKYE